MRILLVGGARPNFVKLAPLLKELQLHSEIESVLVHTGQHYDRAMSEDIFADLEIRTPDFFLGVGSGSHAAQTAEVMKRLEPIIQSCRPDLVVVVGDVNSTLGAALTAVKMGVPVAHVEAGLRSGDRTMPEEINRILTDSISEILFVTEIAALQNLLREGISPEKIVFSGNVMIDALEASRPRWTRSEVFQRLGLHPDRSYSVLTLHRPSNVDAPETFETILGALREVARHLPIVFPVHPRVRPLIAQRKDVMWRSPASGESLPGTGIVCTEPLGYLDCIALMSRACLVLTDSGGIQEETTILGVPCLTLRDSTERPVTTAHGTNRVIGSAPGTIVEEALWTLTSPPRPAGPPPLWDGRAAKRIVKTLLERQRVGDSHSVAA